jgi:hypothetical protein
MSLNGFRDADNDLALRHVRLAHYVLASKGVPVPSCVLPSPPPPP